MTTPLNPFGFFQRTNRQVTPFHELSAREQRRQENSLLRILPLGTTRQQARATLSQGRRSGRVFRSGTNPTPEQAAETARYQQRSARSRLSSARRRYGVPSAPPPQAPQGPSQPGVFNAYQWSFTPDGHLIETDGRIVQYYDQGAAVNSLSLAEKAELSDRKAEFFRGYLDAMAETENPPGEYTAAKFKYNESGFAGKRQNWNDDAHIRFLQMSYEEFREYGKVIAERLKAVQPDSRKWPVEDWMYH